MFIKLTQGKETTVDSDLFGYLNQFKWHLAPNSKDKAPYAARSIRYSKKKILKEYIHWYVIGKPRKGFVVDHINGNGLDNRRENLRVVTQRMNAQNQKAHRDGKALGAYFDKTIEKWQSKVFVNRKSKTLGWFKTKEEANFAYLKYTNSIA